MPYRYILQEDGTSKLVLEDASGNIAMEEPVVTSWLPVYPSVIQIVYSMAPCGEDAGYDF